MPSQKMSRRQALKILLAASGGLTAAAFLPAKWLKPIVSAGVLPAHARASAPYGEGRGEPGVDAIMRGC